jgi:hypothetical protein
MATSKQIGKKELIAAVVVLCVGAWYVWPSSDTASEPSTKTASVQAADPVKPAIVPAVVQAKPKRSAASILKEDADVIEYFGNIASTVRRNNPDGSDCHDQAAAYLINDQGMLDAHTSFASNPQKAVDSANQFSRQNPSLGIPVQTVADAPAELLKEDKKTLADAQDWFSKHGCAM